jgi:hypothetical protein
MNREHLVRVLAHHDQLSSKTMDSLRNSPDEIDRLALSLARCSVDNTTLRRRIAAMNDGELYIIANVTMMVLSKIQIDRMIQDEDQR